MPSISLFVALICCAFSTVTEQQAVHLFQNFQTDFGVVYKNAEEQAYRFSVFSQNLPVIDRLNRENPYAQFGVTKFSDRTDEEFSHSLSNMTGVSDGSYANITDEDPDDGSLPENFDWRSEGIVTPVKNQGQCGSCWAHAAAEAVESYWAKNTGKLVEVSVQQLVDCNRKLGNSGCRGGLPGPALTYAHTQGMVSASLYPYTAKNGACKLHTRAQVVATVGGWAHVRNNEEHMREILHKYSPMPIAVDATIWKFYQSGVITGKCVQNPLVPINHAVLLSGWGIDASTGVKFWTIRNSWGTNWGEAGYIRIQRNVGKCNVAYRPYVACGCANCKRC